MLSVCITAPIDGSARYSSRCRREFQPNVATRSPGLTPSRRSDDATRRARRTTSPYVERSTSSWVRLTISRSGKIRSTRSAMSRMSRGRSIIKPSMRAKIPPRRVRRALFRGGDAAGEDGAGELVRDGVHVDLVPAAAVHEDRVAAAADELEAGALVGADPRGVPGHDLEQHVAEAQVVERPVEREPGRLGAEARAAPLTEEDPEAGAAVVVVDVHEPARAERLAVATVVDRERRGPRVVLRVASQHVVDPRLL